ncbi:class I SAM-dependent methyltransferase [Halorussus halophilus]|uniref:class I SAM-dependent methyltransferase n=1 Tax=Halorussus halophilus TaxID=2650975 RepID=UPI0013014C81|nr:class I SAM-dependent methyltransferase family protein [Halorussus halophilus]
MADQQDEQPPHLAAVVPKPDSETTIAALRAEGVYDDARKVREYDEQTLALPVTDPPQETAVLEVVEQRDPERRAPGLDSLLLDRRWSEEAVERAPSSWAVVGDIVLVNFDADFDDALGDDKREEVGEALLDLHGETDTVLARGGVSGTFREPDVEVVAGQGDTETVHTEHGTRYALDFASVMFSPGNKAERARMGDVVESGERVFDMFAGIGYFTLPMARAGANVVAVEKNPASFKYLVENAMLNDVQGRVEPFRADCREVEIDPKADRVVMGYYESHEYLDSALGALKSGGVVHMHETTPEDLLWDRPVSRLRDAAASHDRPVEILDRRKVKSHSEGVWHVVVDARVE